MRQLMRGAYPTPRYELAAAVPHKITDDNPAQFIRIPKQLSMWGNDVNGDCVTAEEAFAKACHKPEVFISDTEVINWATSNNFLNGANLTDVLHAMQRNGFVQSPYTYDDGPYSSIDWTNPALLTNAIFTGPVKIGVAATQLENVIQSLPTLANGWFATGFQPDSNEDHCTSLCGYGSMSWLATQLGSQVPSGVDGTQQGYALYTWSTIGVIDVPSMEAITAEAWLRNPTTLETSKYQVRQLR